MKPLKKEIRYYNLLLAERIQAMTILLIIHIFITIAMVGIILMQRSEGGGLGMGGSTSGNMFSARGASNLLTRVTGVLAALFMGNCLLMGIISKREIKEKSSLLAPMEDSATSQSNKP